MSDDLRGWVTISPEFLREREVRSGFNEIESFFSGTDPSWGVATSSAVPRRPWVDRIYNEIVADDRTTGTSRLDLIHGPIGEGKSTILRQVAVRLAARPGFRVAWCAPGAGFTFDTITRIAKSKPGRWVIVADEAQSHFPDLRDVLAALQDSGDLRIRFLIAVNDLAARLFRANPGALARFSDPYREWKVSGLTKEDAGALVEHWESLEAPDATASLGLLEREPDTESRAARLLALSQDSECKKGGSLLGAVLAARTGKSAWKHVYSIIETLRGTSNAGTPRLEAYLHVAAAQAVQLPPPLDLVLEHCLLLDSPSLRREVLEPLAAELLPAPGGRARRTRHGAIAQVAIELARTEFGTEFAPIFANLVRETLRQPDLTMILSPANINAWKQLSKRFLDARLNAVPAWQELWGAGSSSSIARACADAARVACPTELFVATTYCTVMTDTDDPEIGATAAAEAIAGIDPHEPSLRNIRIFLSAWAVAEGHRRPPNNATNAWLAALSVSDRYRTPLRKQNIEPGLASLGVALSRLIESGASDLKPALTR